ncbi:hypothetical protein TNCT_374151 [Trichonephila clavata]|uniref:Uncharacterized protein n=1 Tax=Trichonephila clavata TaxID=2740835 RepID=A0A8X6KKJ9_TRICU|nr:hypothetical protein TNCT_374151 [Trichonephila clavata]
MPTEALISPDKPQRVGPLSLLALTRLWPIFCRQSPPPSLMQKIMRSESSKPFYNIVKKPPLLPVHQDQFNYLEFNLKKVLGIFDSATRNGCLTQVTGRKNSILLQLSSDDCAAKSSSTIRHQEPCGPLLERRRARLGESRENGQPKAPVSANEYRFTLRSDSSLVMIPREHKGLYINYVFIEEIMV